MHACLHVSMYILYIGMYVCVYACMFVCMHADKSSGETVSGMLNLVDLAGSERLAKSESLGQRLQVSGCTAFVTVMTAYAQRTGAAAREPLRRQRSGKLTLPAFHACPSARALSACTHLNYRGVPKFWTH